MKKTSSVLCLLTLPLALLASACGDDEPTTDAGVDAGQIVDTGTDAGPSDTGTDAGLADTGTPDSGLDAGLMDTGTSTDPFSRLSCNDIGTIQNCLEFTVEEKNDFLDAINTLADNTTIILGAGTFDLDNAVEIRNADGIRLEGQGKGVTVLDFANQAIQANGVDVIGDDFTIAYLTIKDAKKDGLRVEDSMNVRIQHLDVRWTNENDSTNGSYAIYPVRCVNVLLEDSEAWNASDAGIYVGQVINAIVRRNIAKQNVAGIEIENTQFADVYENLSEDNAAGLVVFDLPGNPVIGRDIKIHDNTIIYNNRPNFAPTGDSVTTVSQVPAGTGTFALASRRVEIYSNTYEKNDTGDIAILSGIVIESSTGAWAIPIDQVVGSTVGLDLPNTGTEISNFRSAEIWIHDNTHSMSGTAPDGNDENARPLGYLLSVLYLGSGVLKVDEIFYDGVGEIVDPTVAANNTNNNRLCVENEGSATYATLDLLTLIAIADGGGIPTLASTYRPASPFVPFDCTGFTGGPIPEITLP